MTTPQDVMRLGETLIKYCQAQDEARLWQEYYTPDAVSVEAVEMPDGSREARGLAAIQAKGAWWYGAHEVHKMDVEGPFIHGNTRFSVIFDLDVTHKESGERSQMREIGTYYCNDAGQIIREEFSYAV